MVAHLITYRHRAARTLFKHLEPIVQKRLEEKRHLDTLDSGVRPKPQAVSHFAEARPPTPIQLFFKLNLQPRPMSCNGL
jgi:hypothetical protein